MTTTKGAHMVRDWRGVDEGWGRAAADFATLSEPSNCREYVAVHHRLNCLLYTSPSPRDS